MNIPLIRESYGRSFLASLGIHGIAALLFVFGGYLLPSQTIRIGSGAGGGTGGDVLTAGIVDELSGGEGMVKPSLVPKPPALREQPPAPDQTRAIPIPQTIEPKREKPAVRETAKRKETMPDSNLIPTAPEPGSGGAGGRSGGSGGGFGGGTGISIGPGSGGFGDSAYARTVESRISSNWMRPPEGVRVEMIYSFYILANGAIAGIKQEKSSGNSLIDMGAERAIRVSSPLSVPPPEFRGRPIQFVAHFIYPPNR